MEEILEAEAGGAEAVVQVAPEEAREEEAVESRQHSEHILYETGDRGCIWVLSHASIEVVPPEADWCTQPRALGLHIIPYTCILLLSLR